MMKTPSDTGSKEPVYEDFRELIARKEELRVTEKRRRGPIRLLLACFGRCSERAAELLQSNVVLLSAGCVSLVFAGMCVFLIQSPEWNGELSVDMPTSSRVGPALPYGGSMGIVSDVKPLAEHRTEAAGPSHSSEAFIIRIGSFRNPSNAKRVVESLREQTLDVKTEVLAGGLHVVMLGPFPQKGAAENAARSVREAIGLAPQVVQLHLE